MAAVDDEKARQLAETSNDDSTTEKDSSHPATEKAEDDVATDKANEAGGDEAQQRRQDPDIEAQGDHLGVERVESNRTGTSRTTRRSMLSRLSKSKSGGGKEKLPPPVLPITELDKSIVGWDGQDDPAMPLNFPRPRKWLYVALLSAITFMTPFASSILAPAIQSLEEDYGVTDVTLGAMPVSIFLLGYAVGPLFLSPLSEIYGRNVVLISANAYFCLWLIGCALAPSIDTLIFFRFMCGVGGSACQTIGGALIADLFPVSERGSAMSIWMLGPMFGPSVAPVIGGFVSQTIGWRWVNWITFIPATLVVVVMVVVMRETNHQVLIARKTEKLRKELGRPELRSCYIDPEKPVLSKRRILLNGLVRPIKMLFTSAIIFSVSLYIAFAYGCLYLLFNTIPIVFMGTYDWTIGISGLVYLSLLVGYGIGLFFFSRLSDRTVVRMTAANGGVYEPEMRLPDCIWFALVLPISFFWYGWSADKGVHWIVPIIGIVPFAMGIVGVWLPTQAYIIDAYPQHAASGLAAFSVLRSIVAAFLPLAGPKMYESLGIGWGTSLLGFIAVGLIPIPTLIYKYGGKLRKRFPLSL